MPSQLTVSLMMGPLAASPVPRSVMEALSEVSVLSGADGQPSSFDLKFATSKASPITTELLPSGFFDPPNRVIITATLNGIPTVLMDGVITQQEVIPSDEAGKSQLSIKGEDLTRMMDVVDFSALIPYPAMPAEARVALMLVKYLPLYQIMPMIIPSLLLFVQSPLDTVESQTGTDLQYTRYLARRVGYTFYLQPGPVPGMSMAYWGPKLRTAIPFLPPNEPFAIDWDGRSNVESLQFSFDGFKKTQFVVLLKITDVPVPLPIPVPDITPLSPPLGIKDPIPLKITPMSGLSAFNPVAAAAIAMGRAADAANVINGSGALDVLRYGAILNPRTMVTVQGAGVTYDGDYYVDTVTHTIKLGSYKQSFTLLRNRLIAQQAGGTGLGIGPLGGAPGVQLLSALPSSLAPQPASSPGGLPIPALPPAPSPLPDTTASPLAAPAPGSPPIPSAGGSVNQSLPASPNP